MSQLGCNVKSQVERKVTLIYGRICMKSCFERPIIENERCKEIEMKFVLILLRK